jgi:hypothetical protein
MADPMNMRLGIILGALAFAGTAFAGSTADYIGLVVSRRQTQMTLDRTRTILLKPYFKG